MYDTGKLNYVIRENETITIQVSENKTLEIVQNKLRKDETKNLHQKIQYQLATSDNAIGYQAWIASNDHSRMVDAKRLGDFSLPSLPQKIQDLPDHLRKTIGLIDVI